MLLFITEQCPAQTALYCNLTCTSLLQTNFFCKYFVSQHSYIYYKVSRFIHSR